MKKYSSSTNKMTMGLDVGDQYSYYVVLDGEAEVMEEGRIRTRQQALEKKFAGLERSRVAEDRLPEECEWKPSDHLREHEPLQRRTAPSCLTGLAFSWKPWALFSPRAYR